MQVKINKTVFFSSTILIFLIVGVSALFPKISSDTLQRLQQTLIEDASWFYVLSVALILLLSAYLIFSDYGNIKLGPDHSEPDYSNTSWFAMLFSAGMGIGLMFFGVAEPVMHYINPPDAAPHSIISAKEAMKITFFHWGLHAWSIYAVVALILAYFSFRRSLPLRLSSALYPIFGKRVFGRLGYVVDVFAILATVFGMATSLGYGVKQINAGFHYLFHIPDTGLIKVILIVSITCLASISVATGLDKGIKRLSELNILLAAALMLFILVLGPTNFLLKTFVENTGAYLSEIVSKTFNLYAYKKNHWIGGWTLLYWCWWLSWSPFVGMFIARISRGRTIREFMLGVILIPSAFTLLWMTVFGNTAISMLLQHQHTEIATIVNQNTALALFKFLEYFPLHQLLSFIATLMVIVFFVTSYDSGAMVIDIMASDGSDDTPVWQRIYWTGVAGLIAIVLLLVGGLQALQSATIASALPFTLILLAACYGLLKALKIEGLKRQAMLNTTNISTIPIDSEHSVSWRDRIENMLSTPNAQKVMAFLQETAKPALQQIARELEEKGLRVKVTSAKDRVILECSHEDEINFLYGVRLRVYNPPLFALSDTTSKHLAEMDKKKYFRAEIFLREGGQNYDVMGYSKEQLINDVIDQYEKHMHFLDLLR